MTIDSRFITPNSPFWIVGEVYRGSGRISRVWCEQAPINPAGPIPEQMQVPMHVYSDQGYAYPFNGMGGQSFAGPCATEQEAWDEFAQDYPEWFGVGDDEEEPLLYTPEEEYQRREQAHLNSPLWKAYSSLRDTAE